MTSPGDLIPCLHAVARPEETKALGLAARRLAELIKPQGDRRLGLKFAPRQDWSDFPQPGALVIASMSIHLGTGFDSHDLKASWLERIKVLKGINCEDIFLMTIFPSITKAERRAGPDEAASCLQQIRRLNLTAIELSHESGVSIIDISRWFSSIGGSLLETDYRIMGTRAPRIMAEVTVRAILHAGLDRYFDPPPQFDAMAHLNKIIQRLKAMSDPVS